MRQRPESGHLVPAIPQAIRSLTPWSLGLAFWWTWHLAFFFPQPFGVGTLGTDDASALRISVMAGYVLASLVWGTPCLREQLARYPSPATAVGAATMTATAVVGLAFWLDDVPFAVLWTLVLLGSITAGIMFLACIKKLQDASLGSTSLCVAFSVVAGGLVWAVISVVGHISSALWVVLIAAAPWCCRACLLHEKAPDSAGESPAEPAATPDACHKTAHVTSTFLIYAAVYNLAFGIMLSLSLTVADTSWSFTSVTWCSMAGFIASGLTLLAVRLHEGTEAPLDYARRLKAALGLVAIGFVALSALGAAASGLAAFLTIFGYIFFWQLFNVVWIEMAKRTHAPVAPISAWGLGASAFGVALGIGATRTFFGGELPDSGAVNTVCIVACFVLLLMSMLKMDSSVFIDLGGMVEPTHVPTAQDALIARVDAVCAAHGLTPREREIVLMVSRGRNARRIQEDLGVSLATVRTHLHHIYEKCGVHSDQELLDLVEVDGSGA